MEQKLIKNIWNHVKENIWNPGEELLGTKMASPPVSRPPYIIIITYPFLPLLFSQSQEAHEYFFYCTLNCALLSVVLVIINILAFFKFIIWYLRSLLWSPYSHTTPPPQKKGGGEERERKEEIRKTCTWTRKQKMWSLVQCCLINVHKR